MLKPFSMKKVSLETENSHLRFGKLFNFQSDSSRTLITYYTLLSNLLNLTRKDFNMNYYFVDYENVGSDGLNGVDKLDSENTVFIFYTQNADKITFDVHIQLSRTQAGVKYFKVAAGQKNALDFQLSSYLGYIINENDNETSENQNGYFIVSKDSGFSNLVPFWKKNGINIRRVDSLAWQLLQAQALELQNEVMNLTGDPAHSASIAKIIMTSGTKQDVNSAFMKLFNDNQKAGETYKLIKPLLADMKGA